MKTNLYKKSGIKDALSDSSSYSLAKLILAVAAVLNLILSSRYILAILKLENEICGFVMFVFILFGLLVLFQTTRMDKNKFGAVLLCAFVIILTIAVGSLFLLQLSHAVKTQTSLLDPTSVIAAIKIVRSIIGAFFVGLALIIIHSVSLFINTR